MTAELLSKARRHELRIVFWDFALRGEGEDGTVVGAIEEWRAAGSLTRREADRWLDAVRWRATGGFLPGWSLPGELKEKRGEPDESDLRAFEAWRTGLRPARAA